MTSSKETDKMKIGIEHLNFYVPQYYIELTTIAEQHGVDVTKYHRGIGQEKMSIPPHCEDVVTLGANAAFPIIEKHGAEMIDSVIFCTETGIDQSKSAGIYVHHLLGLNPNCRNVEMKQACYSATAALQLACGYVARKPDKKVLIIASDISRYDLGSNAEPTQGCGAVAMLISSDPKIMEIDAISGIHSEDVMDFWRPYYRKTALVDGKFSAQKYLQSLGHAWNDYKANGGRPFEEFIQFCYHLPFTKMGEKAHRHLSKINGTQSDSAAFEPGMAYNRQMGNSYSASLYISLLSALETCEGDLSGKTLGLFSYGSGCVGEFLSGVVQPGYREQLDLSQHKDMLEDRERLSYETYLDYWHAPDPTDGSEVIIEAQGKSKFRLAGINDHKRHYEADQQ